MNAEQSDTTYMVLRDGILQGPDDKTVFNLFQMGTAAVRATAADGRCAIHILPKGSALGRRTNEELIEMAKPDLQAAMEAQ